MNNDYITIKEFAEIAGVSQQSIYKRIKLPHNPIQPYVKEINGRTYIRKTALDDLYKNSSEQVEPQKEPMERILDILERQLEEKDKQLKERDNQITSLLQRIESLERLFEQQQTLLDQQQQLNGLTSKLLIDKQDIKEDVTEQEQDNKGFFNRFFGKRKADV